MNAARSLERGSRRHPDRPAIIFEGQTLSYRELDEAANRVAHELGRRGVQPGDRVALLLPNTPDFVAAYYGVLKLGAIAVSLPTSLKQPEIDALLADCGAKVLWSAEATLPLSQAEALPPHSTRALPLRPHTPAVILYTSGTTGTPKGATLSHGNIVFTAASKRRYLQIGTDDRLLLFLPLFHCFGQNAVLNAAIYSGATVVLHRAFDADAVLESIARDRVTMFFGVPTTYVMLLEHATPSQLSGIRLFFSAAAPLAVEIEARWEERFGAPIVQGYGLTESSPFASFNHGRRGSLGKAIDRVSMRVAAAPGEKGEIEIRGPNVMLGYWNRPKETNDAIRDGWLRTGDVGRMDAGGWLTLEDRVKDMIAVGGVKVYPAEVEQVLAAHPTVAEAAVYGVSDPVMGERVRAAVVLRGETSRAALIAWCRERLADFKVPAEIDVVAELPRGRTGKVLKRVLREQHQQLRRDPRALSSRELERRIAVWLGEKLSVDPARVDTRRPFTDHGLTSIAAVELAAALASWLGRDVPPLITWQFSTAASLARHLETSS